MEHDGDEDDLEGQEDEAEEREGPRRFFGCYLLTSRNEAYRRHTYIGFTVNPSRRIRQHNGELVQGAKRTRTKRPWEMVMVVYGFPSKTAALRFEWGWTYPQKSRRIKEALSHRDLTKLGSPHMLKARLRLMFELLHVTPWNRFPLVIHWLTQEYHQLLDGCPPPPRHMKVNIGSLAQIEPLYKSNTNAQDSDSESLGSDSDGSGDEASSPDSSDGEAERRPTTATTTSTTQREALCCLCRTVMKEDELKLRCLKRSCKQKGHMLCWAQRFLRDQPDVLLPTTGTCPSCQTALSWPEMLNG